MSCSLCGDRPPPPDPYDPGVRQQDGRSFFWFATVGVHLWHHWEVNAVGIKDAGRDESQSRVNHCAGCTTHVCIIHRVILQDFGVRCNLFRWFCPEDACRSFAVDTFASDTGNSYRTTPYRFSNGILQKKRVLSLSTSLKWWGRKGTV